MRSIEWCVFNDPEHNFKGMSLFDVEYLRNDTRQRHSYNGILIKTYAVFYGINSNDLA